MFSGYCEFTQIYSVYLFYKSTMFSGYCEFTQIYSVNLFYKSTMVSGYCEFTQKKRLFTVPDDYYITFMSNNYGVFNLFPLIS